MNDLIKLMASATILAMVAFFGFIAYSHYLEGLA